MLARSLRGVAVSLILLAVGQVPGAIAKGSAKPSIHISPSSLHIVSTASLTGSHLSPNTFYTGVLTIPVKSRPNTWFIGLAKTDGHGNLKMAAKIPIVTHCGHATVAVYPMRKNQPVSTAVRVTGCTTAKKGVVPPPPPPGKGKP